MRSTTKKFSQVTLTRAYRLFDVSIEAGARPVDNITIMRFLPPSLPDSAGASDSARQLVAATKIARTVRAGG